MNQRITALDGWRAISVGFVIIDHLMQFSAVRLPAYEAWFSRLGNLGVSIFFVISGYVICRGLMQESQLYRRVSLAAFYTRRFFRIVPPLTAYVCVIFILSLAGIISTNETILRALTFSCDLPNANCGRYLGNHTWSLSVEEQFYLAAPFLFAIAQPKRGAVVTSLIAGAALMVIAMTALGNDQYAIFIANFLPISVGVWCAVNEERCRQWLRRAPVWILCTTPFALILAARFTLTHFWLLGLLLIGPAIAVTLMSSGQIRFLSWRPLTEIGRASYGIYLWQQLATYAFPGAGVSFYVVSVSACLLLSLASFHYLERPLIGFGRRLSDRLRNRAEARAVQPA